MKCFAYMALVRPVLMEWYVGIHTEVR